MIKITICEDLPVYMAKLDNLIDEKEINVVNMNPEEELKTAIKNNSTNINFYKINVKKGSNGISFTNCIFYDNQKISIATDIGHMSSSVIHNLEESSFILLESNYDPNILKCSKYPYQLKQRIAGPLGHLPNEEAGKTISYLMQSGLNNVMLGHLSKENNFPELAYKTVIDELIQSHFDETKINIQVANRMTPSPIIELKGI